MAILFDVAAAVTGVTSNDNSVPPLTARQLCADFVHQLKERQAVRQVTRTGETPWYPSPSVSLGIAPFLVI